MGESTKAEDGGDNCSTGGEGQKALGFQERGVCGGFGTETGTTGRDDGVDSILLEGGEECSTSDHSASQNRSADEKRLDGRRAIA